MGHHNLFSERLNYQKGLVVLVSGGDSENSKLLSAARELRLPQAAGALQKTWEAFDSKRLILFTTAGVSVDMEFSKRITP